MKRCPFCAEEIQDAAIKCRYCGTTLTEATPTPVQNDAAPNEEVKGPLGRGNRFREAFADGRTKGRRFNAVVATWAPALTSSQRKTFENAFVTLFVLLVCVPLFVSLFFLVFERFDERVAKAPAAAPAVAAPAPAPTTGAASPPAQAAAGRQRTAATESSRRAFNTMVQQGLIKRSDLKSGKFYIWGDMWEGFELDAKEQIVRVISEHRDAEFGLPQVRLVESRSGKELATLGAFSGVTIR